MAFGTYEKKMKDGKRDYTYWIKPYIGPRNLETQNRIQRPGLNVPLDPQIILKKL